MKYYEHLNVHIFDNLSEMDKFLKRHNFQKLIQEEIDNLNRLIHIEVIESIINNIPKQKAQGPDGLTGKFHQTNT